MKYKKTDIAGGHALNEDIVRLESLLRDLRAIRDGDAPSEATLLAAPVLSHWTYARRLSPCFTGYMSGHPDIGEGHYGVTSEIWFTDPQYRFVRSLSRFYRLGMPARVSGSLN
ncbi:DUF6634 family protein [Phyllobacterium sophorae]|uniref:Uncharacterized protein n=1 Tax=Phyllobacterium sophorae TaxID=1520277 RepID=A0A2P7BFV0_9HYPH|nr:DUF6634 family protein [Phyllobacterium sophorae]PSH65298.1 hypothetical protein CU103_09865 [Phyllobacterium sophorae]